MTDRLSLRLPAVLAVALAVAITGCALLGGAEPVRVPAPHEIRSIVVRQSGTQPQPQPPTVIEDRDRIERFAEWIGERDSGWRQPWDTFPSGDFTVVVDAGEDRGAVFWPGRRHIGGRQFDEEGVPKRLRSLSADESAELLEILGVDQDGAPR